MTTSTENKVESMVTELVRSHDAFVYDVEFSSGILRVTVDRDGGIDVDKVGELSRTISTLLDQDEDLIPGSSYLLEVTSPGIERKLRKPRHFQAVIGSNVKMKLNHGAGAQRRVEGLIQSADDQGFVLNDGNDEQRSFQYTEIQSAHLVYDFTAALEAAKKSSAASDDNDNDDDEKATAR